VETVEHKHRAQKTSAKAFTKRPKDKMGRLVARKLRIESRDDLERRRETAQRDKSGVLYLIPDLEKSSSHIGKVNEDKMVEIDRYIQLAIPKPFIQMISI